MKVSLMQPYFFPYIGQFQIINAVDRFILVDEVQYIKAGWIHRNRILRPSGGWQYIIVPTGKRSFSSTTLIRDVVAVEGDRWKQRILGQTGHYKETAPYYSAVYRLLRSCFETDERSIARLNGSYFKTVCDYIGIEYEVEISSQMGLGDFSGYDRQDRSIAMCRQLGGTALINPSGGASLYDKARFADSGIDLRFLEPSLTPYDQRRERFEPALSIIDVMMFNAPSDIRAMLSDYRFI